MLFSFFSTTLRRSRGKQVCVIIFKDLTYVRQHYNTTLKLNSIKLKEDPQQISVLAFFKHRSSVNPINKRYAF